MRSTDSYFASSIAATTASFPLAGGRYAVAVVATFGGGSVKFQMLGPDNSTYLDVKQAYSDGSAGTETDLVIGTFLAAGMKVFDIPPGQYRLTVATATAIYAAITRVPLE